MAYKFREEIVGKRFLSVLSSTKLKLGKISEWEWRCGVVRAVTHKDAQNPEVSNQALKSSTEITRNHEVLVEFDDVDWTRREWIKIIDIFQVFLVENTIVWAPRPDPKRPHLETNKVNYPALNFKPIVDKVGLFNGRTKPVEFFVDRHIEFVEDSECRIYKEDDRSVVNATRDPTALQAARKWVEYQDSQQILLQTPSVLVGYCRAEVYRAEGTTQWYTAIINSYNENTRELSVTDDTVLEEHNVNPALVQIKLLDAGVVESILRGEDLGIRPRKTRRNIQDAKRTLTRQEVNQSTGDSCGKSPVSGRTCANIRKTRHQAGDNCSPSDTPPSTPTTNNREKDGNEVNTPKCKTPRSAPKRKVEASSVFSFVESTDKVEEAKSIVSQKRAKSLETTIKSKDRTNFSVNLKDSKSTLSDYTCSRESSLAKLNKPLKEKVDKGKTKLSRDTEPGKTKQDSSSSAKQNKERLKSSKKSLDSPASSANSSQVSSTDSLVKFSESTADTATSIECTAPSDKQHISNKGSKLPTQENQKGTDSVVKAKNKRLKAKDKEPVSLVETVSQKEIQNDSNSVFAETKNKKNNEPKEKEVKKLRKEKPVEKLDITQGNTLPVVSKAPGSVGDNKTTRNLKSSPEKQHSDVEVINQSQKGSPNPETEKSGLKEYVVKQLKPPSSKKSRSKEGRKEKGSNSEESGTMHYKKIHLLADMHKKEGSSQEREKESEGHSTSGINLNHSVTDQIAKLSAVKPGGERRWESPQTVSPSATSASIGAAPYHGNNMEAHRNSASMSDSRHCATLSSHMDKAVNNKEEKMYSASSSREHNNNHHDSDLSRTVSGESKSSSRASEERRPNSSSSVSNPRMEDFRNPSRDAEQASSASPLLFDMSRPVEPYRDPELLKKDEMLKKDSEIRRLHLLQQAQQATVGQGRPATHTPVPPPHTSSYPKTHTPVGPPHASPHAPALPHQAHPLLTPLPTYPPHPLSPQLPLPPHLAAGAAVPGVDRSSLGLSALMQQQQQQAAQLHMQQLQHILQQQPHLLQSGYTLHNSLTRQLEMLWQQKYPTLAVPPAWMLLQYQDELLRDVTLLQQRDKLEWERREREMLERERVEREMVERERERVERELAERDRVERDRQERERQERDRQERDRQERERREREKQERELVEQRERERQERDKQERERKEKERQQHEQQQRLDRHRVLLESAAAADAVNQHFQESLRLASAKMSAAGGTWNPTPSMARPKQPPSLPGIREGPGRVGVALGGPGSATGSAFTHVTPRQPSPLPDSKKPDDKPTVSQQQQMLANLQIQQQQQIIYSALEAQKQDLVKREGDSKPPEGLATAYSGLPTSQKQMEAYYQAAYHAQMKAAASSASSASYPPSTNAAAGVSTPAGSHVKTEPNFSLYGYQPFPHMTYISQEKLYQHGLKEEKGSVIKSEHPESKHSPHAPAATTKTGGKKSGFASPPPLIKSEVHGQPSSVIVENKSKESVSGYHQSGGSITLGTPGSLRGPAPGIKQEPRPMSVPASVSQVNAAANVLASMSSSGGRTQSPLCVASPRHLSQAVMQPMDLQKHSQSGTGVQQPAQRERDLGGGDHPHSAGHQTQPGATTAQPPVSLPVTSVGTYSFSLIQQGLVPNPIYTQTSHGNTMVASSESQHGPTAGGTAGQRGQHVQAGSQPHAIHSPSSSQQQTNKRKSNNKDALSTSSRKKSKPEGRQQPASPGPVIYQSFEEQSQAYSSSTTVTYMDSFRSFVENAVQSAFYQDNEMSNRGSAGTKGKSRPVTTTTNSTTKTQPTSQTTPANVPLPSSANRFQAVGTTTVSTTPNTFPPVTFPSLSSVSVSRPGPASTPGGASVSSTSSIMETINRVANGIVDTDSDTLSAPSPPPHIKGGENSNSSPLKSSGNATKFKKAWLQRYSDEDKKNIDVIDNKNEPKNEKGEPVKDCYVNCSYISPTKDGGGKSPISMLKDLTSRKDEDSTSSASEMESQGTDAMKRRTKPKRRGSTSSSSSKKIKHSDDESTTSNTSSGKKPSRKAKTEKAEKGDKVVEREESKEKEEPKEVKKEKSKKLKEAAPKEEKYIPKSDCEIKLEKKRQEMKEKGITTRDNPSTILATKPLNKEPHAKLKKSMEPFHQDGSCTEVTPKLMKCRECKMTPNQRNKNINVPNIFCRFYAFRRLKFSTKGFLTIAGFCQPSDADADDVELWMPCLPLFDPQLDVDMAKYVIANVGDRFCELVEQEKEAMSLVSPDVDIAWKRAVQGVREMCDVCNTTLFNIHWVCRKCGFVVCIDCYRMRTRRGNACNDTKCPTCVEGGQRWLTCSANKQPHEPEKLMITQIIPSDVLWVLGRMIHEVRDKWHISANCPCGRSTITPKNGVSQQLINAVNQSISGKRPLMNGVNEDHGKGKNRASVVNDNSNSVSMDALSPLSLLAETAVSRETEALIGKFNGKAKKMNSSSSNGPRTPESSNSQDEDEKEGKGNGQCSTLRDLLTRTTSAKAQGESKKPVMMNSTLEDIIQKVVERNHPQSSVSPRKVTFTHYIPRSGISMQGRDCPIPQYNLTETSLTFPNTPHSWLDSGRLLRLHDPRNKNNLPLFQQQWRRSQPVLVSECHKLLNKNLWHPDTFARDFGGQENDLVNCHNQVVLIGHDMEAFWNGFERMSSRLTDENGSPMILKLKDWPPTEDFGEMMPKRFKDLMNGLPLPEYTHRNGVYNLVSRLPEFFVKPDLGPKMYNAYGTAMHPSVGSTNLHLDVSDAVNVMVYVGIPVDDKENHEAAALRGMEQAGVCELTKLRVKDAREKPGALWHIFDPQDADKIREFLNCVATERGETIESHHDPIHDQSWYLDEALRERILNEYGVQGYTILQCLGDAVFIPAGAPHQVRNLHSCIKCAEDFVSPENMNYCFKMTQEFRHLSDTHSNHEDKLQVKNIIYHAVKDAIAILRENNP